MKALVITIRGDKTSEFGASRLLQSHMETEQEFPIELFEASTTFDASQHLDEFDLKWSYPWEGEVYDFASGLKKRAYAGRDPMRRVACAMSHFRIWAESFNTGQTFLVLEHDAMFTQKLPWEYILEWDYQIVGINDPRGATRRWNVFAEGILKDNNFVQPVPAVDEFNVPQGLAGNSAYIIKPAGAERCLQAAYKYGLWPNDALMCKQLVKGMGVTKEFYTKIQGLPSTTT